MGNCSNNLVAPIILWPNETNVNENIFTPVSIPTYLLAIKKIYRYNSFLSIGNPLVAVGGSSSRKILRFNTIVFRKDKSGIILKIIIRTSKIRVLWGLKVVPFGRNKGI